MTKQEFESKIDSILDAKFIENVKAECMRLVKSGALDLESYPNTYSLPRLVLAVALENLVHHYFDPMNRQEKMDAVNLRKF